MSEEQSSDSLGPETPTDTVGPWAEPPAIGLVAGRVLGARFRIEERLGSGSYGVVYRARDLRLDQDVAIKVLRTERLDARGFERVKREARLARAVRGEGLVRIFDLEEVENHLFLVMELVVGGTLREEMRRDGPLSFERARALSREILECLAQLHGQNVLHRDIKPANILIDPEGRLRLTDFGLARSLAGDARLTATGRTVGSAAYLAPESGEAADARSDLYSFGVVLFEMLSGRLPFEADDPLDLIKAHLRDEAPDLRALVPDVPAELAELVRGLLAKSPEQRPASAEAALLLLGRAEADASVVESTGSSPEIRGDGGPSRFAIAAAITVGLLLLAALLSSMLGRDGRDTPSSSAMPASAGSESIENRPEGRDRGESSSSGKAPDRPTACHLSWLDGEPLEVEIWSASGRPWRLTGAVDAEPITLRSGREMVVAIFDNGPGEIAQRFRIELWDCASGTRLRSVGLRRFHDYFEPTGLSDSYSVQMRAEQDREPPLVWLDFLHTPYWPSYAAAFDPESVTVHSIFYNSGHAHFLGRADVDGDGYDEVLYSGTNNRLGFLPFLAAVRLSEKVGIKRYVCCGYSPDIRYTNYENELVWYELLPKSVVNGNPGTRLLDDGWISLTDARLGRERLYRIDGTDASKNLGAEQVLERRAGQNRAFASFRNAETHLRRSRKEQALASFLEARNEAERVDDASLAWWTEIRIGQLLIRLGRISEAEAHFARVMEKIGHARPESLETLFQKAMILHLEGRVAESIEPYEQALELSGLLSGSTRLPWEILENLVLASRELGRWQTASAAIEAYRDLHPHAVRDVEPYRAYARWQRGEPGAVFPERLATTDLPLYWFHELRWTNGGEAEVLLERVRKATERSSESKGMLWALEAVLAKELGRVDASERACEKAVAWLERWRAEVVAARGHADIITARCSETDSPSR